MATEIPGIDPFSKSFSTNISSMYTDLQAKFDYLVVENNKLKEDLIEARKGQSTGTFRKPILLVPVAATYENKSFSFEDLSKEYHVILDGREGSQFQILN